MIKKEENHTKKYLPLPVQHKKTHLQPGLDNMH